MGSFLREKKTGKFLPIPSDFDPTQFAYLAGNDPRWAWRAHIIKIVDPEIQQGAIQYKLFCLKIKLD